MSGSLPDSLLVFFMNYPVLSLSGLLICGSYLVSGIVDAISGGGGLITMSMFMAVGFPVHYIVGTNQVAGPPGALISLIRFAKRGHICWPAAMAAMPAAILGSICGARLNLIVPTGYLQMIMIILVPIVALIIFFKPNFGSEDHSAELSRFRLLLQSALIGLVLGAYQGFYGAGSGTFFMICFATINRFDLLKASGITKFVVFAAFLGGGLTYILNGAVCWPIALAAMCCYIVGSYFGAGIAMTRGAKLIRPMFLVILVLLMIRLVITFL